MNRKKPDSSRPSGRRSVAPPDRRSGWSILKFVLLFGVLPAIFLVIVTNLVALWSPPLPVGFFVLCLVLIPAGGYMVWLVGALAEMLMDYRWLRNSRSSATNPR